MEAVLNLYSQVHSYNNIVLAYKSHLIIISRHIKYKKQHQQEDEEGKALKEKSLTLAYVIAFFFL